MFFVYCVPIFSLLKSCCTTVIHVKLSKYCCKLLVKMEQFCNPRCMLCIYQSNKSPPLKKSMRRPCLEWEAPWRFSRGCWYSLATFLFDLTCHILSHNSASSELMPISRNVSQQVNSSFGGDFTNVINMRTALSGDITQRIVVIPYRRFGTTCRSLFKDQEHPESWPLKMGLVVPKRQ